MKRIIQTNGAKIIVNIAMIAVFFAVNTYNLISEMWKSPHCIYGIILCGLMVLHICQHWAMTKAFTRKKVIMKNKITALMLFSFLLITAGIIVMIFGFNTPVLKYHHIIGHLFSSIVIIHTIQKFKRLKMLLKPKQVARKKPDIAA